MATLTAFLLVGALGVVTAPPATATDACAGLATATTGAPLRYPVTVSTSPSIIVGQPQWASWSMAASPGLSACAPNLSKSISATGVVNGWCGLNTGTAVTANGHRFNWVNVGSTMVITGGLYGVAHVVANAAAGHSCMSGATSFIMQFGVATAACATKF
ncbi:MAG TPA: hypothetical protein VHN78_10745, partial [Chloroflexota bacterium]|nr:hypothetical protein [Chloroflexota bacterium]